MRNDNLASVTLINTKDGDGSDSSVNPAQILIDVAENGYIVNIAGTEQDGAFVYLFDGHGPSGPKAMIQRIIDTLGLIDKVKLQQ